MQIEDNVRGGMSPKEARFAALWTFGGLEQAKEEYRDRRGVPVVEAVGRDLRHAARALRRAPGFTIVALATLAVGIGAGTAVFSVVNAVLLRSLAVPNPQDLRILQWTGTDDRVPSLAEQPIDSGPRRTAHSFPHPLFSSLRELASGEAAVFGFIPIDSVAARARGDAFPADGVMVSDNFFDDLGVRPVLGRLFAAGQDEGTAPNVVITDGWWERLYARDPGALGQTVLLNGAAFNVMGVLPADFAGVLPGDRREFYVLMSARPQFFKEPFQTFTSNHHWWIRMMARLKAGSSDAQLGATLTVAFARQAAEVHERAEGSRGTGAGRPVRRLRPLRQAAPPDAGRGRPGHAGGLRQPRRAVAGPGRRPAT